jgi:beta-xylosidase
MLAVDPEIQLIGPELHQYAADLASTPKDSQGKDWMTEFLRANGDLVDIVSIHRYPFPRGTTGTPVTIDDLRQNSAEWDEIIPYLRGLVQEITGRDIPIAVTEINTHWSKTIQGEATPDSFYNAIWWADVLGRMITQDVYMVNHWLIVSTGAQGGWGIVDRGAVRPSYYVFMLYQQFGKQQVYAASGVENVSIYAAQRDDGALTLMVINLADKEQTVSLDLCGDTPDSAEVWRFDADHTAENLGSQPLSSDALALPGQSITLLVLP